MSRAHFLRPIRDAAGALISSADIRVLLPDTSTPYPGSIYADDTAPTLLSQPWTVTGGLIDFYLDDSTTVDLEITVDGDVTLYESVPVTAPASRNPTYSAMTYDGSDNLTAWTEDGVVCSATYDPTTGNMLTMTVGSVTRTFTYDGSGRMTGAT